MRTVVIVLLGLNIGFGLAFYITPVRVAESRAPVLIKAAPPPPAEFWGYSEVA